MRNTVEGWQLNNIRESVVSETPVIHMYSYSCLWIWATCFWLSFLSLRVSFQVFCPMANCLLFLWWQNLTNWAQSPPNTDLWVLKFMIKQFGCACSEEMEKLNFSSASVAVLAMISDQKVVVKLFLNYLNTWNLNIGMIYGNKSSDSALTDFWVSSSSHLFLTSLNILYFCWKPTTHFWSQWAVCLKILNQPAKSHLIRLCSFHLAFKMVTCLLNYTNHGNLNRKRADKILIKCSPGLMFATCFCQTRRNPRK